MTTFKSIILLFCWTTIYCQTCLSVITALAEKDKCLSSRAELKNNIAKNSTSFEEFGKKMTNLTTCNGTYFACGLTRSWVSEVFEGLAIQFNEYKYDNTDNAAFAGYRNYIGQELYTLFATMKGYTKNTVIYHLRHVGSHDHVWVIEQLSNGGGYRIYQSYQDGFSLKAWLADNVDGMYNDNTGEIKNIVGVKTIMNNSIVQMTKGANSLNNLENIPDNFKPFLPFLVYVRDYNGTQAVNNFKISWNLYGKGQTLDWNSFSNYLYKLSNLTEGLKTLDKTNTPFNQSYFDDWIALHGSPNPQYYPGIPTNLIVGLINPKASPYRLEILPVLLRESPNCTLNKDVMTKNGTYEFKIEKAEVTSNNAHVITLSMSLLILVFCIFS